MRGRRRSQPTKPDVFRTRYNGFMTPSPCALILFLSVGVRDASARHPSVTKPVITAEMIVDYVAPPSTLEEAVLASAAIVVVVAETERTYQPPIAGASTRLILRDEDSRGVAHASGAYDREVEVYRGGGDTDH